MALDDALCDGELSEFLCVGRPANQIPFSNGTDELCDNIFRSYSKNCMKCDYLDPNKTDQHNVTFDSSDSLILMHVNIRPLNKNFDEFHDYVQSLPFILSVLCLSESRIKTQPQVNIELVGYNFINISPESNAGGVALCIHSRIKYMRDKCFSLHDWEYLWLNLHQPPTEKK